LGIIVWLCPTRPSEGTAIEICRGVSWGFDPGLAANEKVAQIPIAETVIAFKESRILSVISLLQSIQNSRGLSFNFTQAFVFVNY
jgi:hypothetical protein